MRQKHRFRGAFRCGTVVVRASMTVITALAFAWV